jgi:hypothetical protein
MKLKFKGLAYQTNAVEAVADCCAGWVIAEQMQDKNL